MWTRLGAAVYGTVALAAPALAQQGGDVAPDERSFAWLWIVAAVLVVAALLTLFFGTQDRAGPHPPARRP